MTALGGLDVPRFDGPALCAETDPDAFFPEKGGTTKAAKKLCNGCEIKAECLEWAVTRGERHGVWGGLSERERRRLRPQARVAVVRQIDHGTEAGYKAHRRREEKACRPCLDALRDAKARRGAA